MRLKELRKARNITQVGLAKELHMAPNTISRYENGKRDIKILELIRIANYFHVSIDYLLERTDNPQMNK